MKATQVIRTIVEEKEMKYSELAFQLNVKKNVLSERLRQDNISIDKMNELLRVLGYKMVAVPYDTPVKDEWFDID